MKRKDDAGLQYVKKFGFQVIRSINSLAIMFEKTLGKEETDKFNNWVDKRANGNGSIEDQIAFYDFKNETFKKSLTVSEAFDAVYYRKICNWLNVNRFFLGNKILDVGCDNGIVTCFLASMLPEAEIVGIDRSKNAISIAEQVAKFLNLKNVKFIHSSLEKYDGTNFDTVISFRVSQEACPNISCNEYEMFYNVSKQFRLNFRDYIDSLLKCLKEHGFLITGDMVDLDPYCYGMLSGIVHAGCDIEMIHYLNYSQFEKTIPFSIIIASNLHDQTSICEDSEALGEEINNSSSKDDIDMLCTTDLLKPYCSSQKELKTRYAFVDSVKGRDFSEPYYEGWLANIVLEEKADKLLEGYNLYYMDSKFPVLLSLWSNAKDNTAVIYFGPSEDWSVQSWGNMDIKKKDEMAAEIHNSIRELSRHGSIYKITKVSYLDGRFCEEPYTVSELNTDNITSSQGLLEFLKASI